MRNRTTLIAAALLLVLGAAAGAGVIQTAPGDFAVLAGGTLGTGAGVHIGGMAGAVGNVWLGNGTQVAGDFLTAGKLETGQNVVLTGRAVAGGNVWFGNGTTVGPVHGSQRVDIGRSVTVGGNLITAGNLNVNRNSVVHGAVSYGGSFWAHSSVAIDGPTGLGLLEPDVWSPSFRDDPGLAASTTAYLYSPRNSTLALLPDTFGRIDVDRGSTVYLAAGTYDLDRLWLGRETHVVADTTGGDIILNLAHDLITDRDVVFERIGAGRLTIQAGDYMYLGSGNYADASILSFGNLDVNTNAVIEGYAYAGGNVWLGNNVDVRGAGAGIPEPVTLAFLATGSVGLLLHRRR